jgi:hypothetical protein
MLAPNQAKWRDANQSYLAAEFARLSALLGEAPTDDAQRDDAPSAVEAAASEAFRERMSAPPAIDALAMLFGLSGFERDLLLLCAGVEMDSAILQRCAEISGRGSRSAMSFGLALARLAAPHWSALAPGRPLRRYRLIEIDAAQGLTTAPLRIDERILHYLAGVNTLDARLEFQLARCEPPTWMAEPHRMAAHRAAQALGAGEAPVIALCGEDADGQRDAAAFAAERLGLQLYETQAEALPTGAELAQFATLWEREALLLPGALLVACPADGLPAATRRFVERASAPLFVSCREPIALNRPMLRFDVDKPEPAEQKRLWEAALGPAAAQMNGALDALCAQFRFSARTIFVTRALGGAEDEAPDAEALWSACRVQARTRLEDLAERIVPAAGWDDLVLPVAQKQILRHLASQARTRLQVYESWGFAAKGRRGLGLSALFAGASGTGKTMAAEVLAGELKLDLYRIDLSHVVSKYIGETSHNLSQVFDAAEGGGALLLFDEADALFGKRSDVKDSHDRYANIEVSYLLQRMEAYRGLAILTSNLKSSLDKAFQRRLRFIVHFPFPDAAQREAIWRRTFPQATPTQGLEPKLLAQLNVAGGAIRNIALNAAFLAAAAGSPVSMSHVFEAAQLEAQKLERPLSEVETRGWL